MIPSLGSRPPRVTSATRFVVAASCVHVLLIVASAAADTTNLPPPPPPPVVTRVRGGCHNATGACRSAAIMPAGTAGLYRCLTTRRDRLRMGDVEELAVNASRHVADRAGLLGHATRFGFRDVDGDEAEHVPWSARCDGVADCPDGTDELHCHHLPWSPSHPSYHTGDNDEDNGIAFDEADGTAYATDPATGKRTERRLERGRVMHPQFSESTCIGCTCFFGGLEMQQASDPADTHPWFEFGLAARAELGLNDACPAGRGCNPINTRRYSVKLYKKHRLCRMAVCCVRQENCIGCRGRVSGATAAKKCWGDAC